MQIHLKIKNISVKRLVSNDSSYQFLLEGLEGCDYSEAVGELTKLQQAGKFVMLTDIPEVSEQHDEPRVA